MWIEDDGTRVSWTDRLFRTGSVVWAIVCVWAVLTDTVMCAQSTCLIASSQGAQAFELALVSGYGVLLWIVGVASLGLLTMALRRAGARFSRPSRP